MKNCSDETETYREKTFVEESSDRIPLKRNENSKSLRINSLLGTAAQLHINNGSKKLDKNSLTFKIFMYLFYFILLESVFTTLVAILQPLTLVNCSLLPALRRRYKKSGLKGLHSPLVHSSNCIMNWNSSSCQNNLAIQTKPALVLGKAIGWQLNTSRLHKTGLK